MKDFIVEPLSQKQVRAAYALLRFAIPSLGLQAWLKYARPVAARRQPARCGVLVARRGVQAHLCGCVCYRVAQDLHQGPVLVAEHYVALDLLYPERVLAALFFELQSVAAALGCRVLKSLVDAGKLKLIGDLESHGNVMHGVVLVTTVADMRTPERLL